MKKLLNYDELIQHMKNKGITFNVMSEDEAKEFLANHNYYMKLASYRCNYTKFGAGHPKEGQYNNLDFAYLQELSTLDMYLRRFIEHMCLDIEHAIKVRLIDEVTKNTEENGYSIVKNYMKDEDPDLRLFKSIRKHKSGEYCKDLIMKYYPYFPIWVLVEIISFGDLLHICGYYDKKYGTHILLDHKIMNTVRDFRNASAHNNCLMNKMTEEMEESKQPDARITSFVNDLHCTSSFSRKKYMNRTFSYNLVVLLYAYDYYLPEQAKRHGYEDLYNFMNGRMLKHKDYFINNGKIVGMYRFIFKIIDKLH